MDATIRAEITPNLDGKYRTWEMFSSLAAKKPTVTNKRISV